MLKSSDRVSRSRKFGSIYYGSLAKPKVNPPTIQAGYLNIIENLGSGMFADVYLATINLSAFNHTSQPMMALTGPGMVAMKKLKNVNEDTKKEFFS